MAVVFAKTRKGQEEIEHRGGGLTPRVRRVLIFVDGKRTVDQLRAMLAADDLSHTLGMLEEDAYIEVLATQDKAPTKSSGACCFQPAPAAHGSIDSARV